MVQLSVLAVHLSVRMVQLSVPMVQLSVPMVPPAPLLIPGSVNVSAVLLPSPSASLLQSVQALVRSNRVSLWSNRNRIIVLQHITPLWSLHAPADPPAPRLFRANVCDHIPPGDGPGRPSVPRQRSRSRFVGMQAHSNRRIRATGGVRVPQWGL